MTAYAHWDYVKPSSVTVTPASAELFVGDTGALTASADPYTAAETVWSSDNPGTVKVDTEGNIVAVAPGTARITATVQGVSGYADITVSELPPEPVAYTIKFDPRGGATVKYELTTNFDGRLPYLPGASRMYWTFDGWYTDAQAGEKISTETVFTRDSTVYAHWLPIPVEGV